MNRSKHPPKIVWATLLLALVPRLLAQEAPASTTSSDDATTNDETVVLSPFVVSSTDDEGYAAQYTLAGTRIRTDIRDVGSSISVVTAKLLADTATTNATQLLVYTPNTEVVGQGGNFLGAGDSQYAGQVRYGINRVRGLSNADTTRDFFLTNIPWDSYNTGRIDIQRGPNSILFGIGSPAGIINGSLNHAGFKNSYQLQNRVDNFGTVRFSGDFNHVVLNQELAVRVAFLNDDTKFRQEPAFRDDHRLYAALRYDPKFLNRGRMTTSFEATYEKGKIEANLFRNAPPTDYLTPWFTDPVLAAYQAEGVPMRLGTGADTQSLYIGSGSDSLSQGGTMLAYDQNHPTTLGFPHNVGGENAWVGGAYYRGIIGKGTAYNTKLKGKVPGASVDAWKNTVITDRSIFDSYTKLLDGDTKRENMDFDALSLALRQSFLEDTLGYELAFDLQKTHSMNRNYLGTQNYGIAADIMGTLAGGIIGGVEIPDGPDDDDLPDGVTTEIPDPINPNLGRAFVVGSRGSGWNWSRQQLKTTRLTAFYNLDFNKISGRDSKLGTILGSNLFTGLLSRYENKTENGSGSDYYMDDQSNNLAEEDNTYILNYLSPRKLTGSNPAGINLPALAGMPLLTTSTRVLYDSDTKSYSQIPITLAHNWDLPEEQRDYGSADKSIRTIDTAAIVWQGHWFGGNLIPLAAFRRDKSWFRQGGFYDEDGEFQAGAPRSEVNDRTRYYPFDANYIYGEDSPKTTVDSKTYSVVTHTPKRWREKLPGKIDIQLIYNQSENFQPSPGRTDIMNRPIPDPSGRTKEYGVAISAFDDRLYLKVVHYKTKQSNTEIGSFFEGNIGSIAAQEVWARSAAYAHAGLKPGGVGPNADPNHSWQVSPIYGYSSDGHAITFKPKGPWALQTRDQNGKVVPLGGTITTWQGLAPNEPYPAGTVRTEYTQAELDATWAEQNASIQAILNNPPPEAFIIANGIDAEKFFRPEGPDMFDYGGGPASAVVTGDTESEGTELELVANPVKGLNIVLNATRTKAKRMSIAQSYLDYIESRRPFFYGPAGDMRIWSSGEADNAVDPYTQNFNASMSVAFRAQVDSPISKFLAATDSYVPEMHPWTFNTIVNYEFQGDALKGFHVGGGYRWQDKLITGYKITNDEFGNEIYDLANPYYGPKQDAIDLWVGYKRKIWRNLTWHVQLNVRNTFANDNLIRAQVNPDGSGAGYRIPEPRTFVLTNTIEF